MARRFHPRSTPAENLRIIVRSIPWRLLLLLPVIVALAIPTYVFGARIGGTIIPTITNYFYNLSAPAPSPTATPSPPFPAALPQPGSLLYTVGNGDSCDSILTFQMRMADAGEVFSDIKPETVKALDAALGRNCHALQPGMTLPLSPQYPLVALGGTVLKIDATSPQEVVPTPLVNVPLQRYTVDCSSGCLLTVQIAQKTQVRLVVQTTLPIRTGAWIWAQAALTRKTVKNFDTYPYADPDASLNGMTLRACDFQVNDTHDNNSLSCDQLTPNTIDDDGGSWLFGVTGSGGINHWRYPLHLPDGTRVLLWLTAHNGALVYNAGNPLYRYDEGKHVYVKV